MLQHLFFMKPLAAIPSTNVREVIGKAWPRLTFAEQNQNGGFFFWVKWRSTVNLFFYVNLVCVKQMKLDQPLSNDWLEFCGSGVPLGLTRKRL